MRTKTTAKLTKPQRRAAKLEAKVTKRLAHIRKFPRQDKYGRPVPDGSPIGQGDKNWYVSFVSMVLSFADS